MESQRAAVAKRIFEEKLTVRLKEVVLIDVAVGLWKIAAKFARILKLDGNGKRLEIAKALGASDPPITPRTPAPLDSTQVHPGPANSQLLTLDAAMKRHIELALARTRGRIEGNSGAAKLLAINPYTFRARMRKLGIKWEIYRPREGQAR